MQGHPYPDRGFDGRTVVSIASRIQATNEWTRMNLSQTPLEDSVMVSVMDFAYMFSVSLGSTQDASKRGGVPTPSGGSQRFQ